MKKLTNLWKVELECKYTHCKDWLDEDVTVLANGDGEKAVRKAKRHALGMSFTDTRESGDVECKCVRVRLRGLELVKSVDAI